MEGERHRAVGAAQLAGAAAAAEEIRESPPVEEEDGLPPLRVRGTHRLGQLARDGSLFEPHVDDLDVGGSATGKTLGERQPSHGARRHQVPCLHGGRRAPHHHPRLFGDTPAHRHLPRVVAWRRARLVGRFVLLVYHDEAEFAHRREDGAARAHDDRGLATQDAPPLQKLLRRRQPRVEHRAFFSEATCRRLHHLPGEGDLRHQVDDAPALGQRGLGGLEEDLGLARAGEAVEIVEAGLVACDALQG